jgi:formylglycine-generating enzyme required for sulfatase activity
MMESPGPGMTVHFPDHANLIVDHNHPPEGTEPVGSYPLGASREGIHDLVGNVWEWTIVPQSEQDNNSPSPTEMLSPGGFLLRGGRVDSELENITYIPIFPPGFPLPDANIGFRCVK